MDQIMRYRKYLEELQKSEKEGEPAVSTPQSILERLNTAEESGVRDASAGGRTGWKIRIYFH